MDKNTWDGNMQGKLKIVVPKDINSYEIQIETDVPLTNIQVGSPYS